MKNSGQNISEYKNLIIYCFSGTGNALKASEWLIEKAKEYGINTVLYSIDRFEKIDKEKQDGKTLIAFCYPTHGFNAAPLMLKFILKFPRGHADILLLNTRGGLKFKKIYFPGLSGIAQLLPMLFLLLKGYSIAGLLPFDMPSNWISFHPGLTDSAVNDIVSRRQKQLYNFADRLFANQRAFSYKVFLYLPLDLAISPVTAGYYFCGRYMFAKSFYASSECNDCRLCENNCPTNSIKIVNNRPFWAYTCESCMRCIGICPNKSIQTAHTFIIPVIYLISLVPFAAGVFNVLKIYIGEGIINGLITVFLNWGFTVALIIIAYRMFSLLLKIKFINKFFEYTSLTRYWRRYLAPGTGVKKFRMFHNKA
ncbi:MAG: EFR1 family ferrodoxin [Ignavibacteriae bacterium]|nr:EFR1 family ferrodoxin [Ignavibacteriota bacterium]